MNIIDVTKEGNKYCCLYERNALKCEALIFLKRCTQLYWRESEGLLLRDENHNLHLNFISTLSAIGYLVTKEKDPLCARAVFVCNKNGNYGYGKSLLAKFISRAVKSEEYFGQMFDNRSTIRWHSFQENTGMVIVDDLNPRYNLDRFFNCITGEWDTYDRKRFDVPFADSPKMLITSRNEPNRNDPSHRYRLWNVYISDYFNKDNAPWKEFKHHLFTEWDDSQRILFHELIEDCVRIYQQIGYVDADAESLNHVETSFV